jgi:hypothetical protein
MMRWYAMTKLSQCGSCQGFLPRDAEKCPHCSRSLPFGKRALTKKLCAVGATLGAGSLAFTLMACYGMAPCPDGTRDCHRPHPTGTEGGLPTDPSSSPMASPDGGK